MLQPTDPNYHLIHITLSTLHLKIPSHNLQAFNLPTSTPHSQHQMNHLKNPNLFQTRMHIELEGTSTMNSDDPEHPEHSCTNSIKGVRFQRGVVVAVVVVVVEMRAEKRRI
jgi:hypothetical protein